MKARAISGNEKPASRSTPTTPSTYGPQTNWLRNVLAAGTATILQDGSAYDVDRPELVAMSEVLSHFPPSDRQGFKMLNVDHCLRVRTCAVRPAFEVEAASLAEA
jgi:hypothetical protein